MQAALGSSGAWGRRRYAYAARTAVYQALSAVDFRSAVRLACLCLGRAPWRRTDRGVMRQVRLSGAVLGAGAVSGAVAACGPDELADRLACRS